MWKIWCSVGWCNKVTSFRTSAYTLQQNVLSFSSYPYLYSKFTPFSVMIQHFSKQATRSNISLQHLSCDLEIRNDYLFEAQSWSYTRLILRALVGAEPYHDGWQINATLKVTISGSRDWLKADLASHIVLICLVLLRLQVDTQFSIVWTLCRSSFL